MSTSRWIRVGGVRISSIGRPGSLRWSHSVEGGPEQASWEMDLAQTFSHPALRLGAKVEILSGPGVIWGGVLDEPDRGDKGISFSAAGYAAEARGYACFDGSLNTTSIPDTAIDQAIARGLGTKYGITRPSSISNVAFGPSTQTDQLNKLGDLLDAYATSDGGKRWGIDPNGRFYKAADPTTPTLCLRAGAAKVGFAGDDYASTIYLRYKSGPSTYATATASDTFAESVQRRELLVDGTTAGTIDSTKANALAAGELTKGRARYAFTDPVTVGGFQLTTLGGQPVAPEWLAAGGANGLMVRQYGVTNEQGVPLSYLDWVVGRTEVEDEEGKIILSPVNLASRALGDVLADAVA